MKKNTKPLLIIGAVLIVLIIIGTKIRSTLHAPSPKPRTLTTYHGDLINSVTETGSISSKDMVNVNSKVAGRILSLPIEEGQYVVKGQLIATVDRTLIDPQVASTQAQLDQAKARLSQAIASYRLQQVQTQTAIDQARAGLSSAQAHLATVEAGSRPQEIAQQEQAVARAQITLDDANRTLTRRQKLVAKGFIAQADVDSAQVAADTAASSLNAAKQQLDLLKAGARAVDIEEAKRQVASARVQLNTAKAQAVQNDVRKSDILQAQSSVTQTENQLQQLEVQLRDTKIVAPSSGTVLKKYRQVNEIVQSATTSFSSTDSAICVLGNQPMVNVSVNEVDLSKVRVGEPVRVTVDSFPGAVFPARVERIAPVSSNTLSTTGSSGSGPNSVANYPVRITFLRPDARLRPGMTASVQIISAERKDVLLAPLEAIPFKGSSGDVNVLDAGGKTIKKHVVLGLRNDTHVEVVSGLTPGESLETNPINGSDRRKFSMNGPD